jgi:hypothetical protein
VAGPLSQDGLVAIMHRATELSELDDTDLGHCVVQACAEAAGFDGDKTAVLSLAALLANHTTLEAIAKVAEDDRLQIAMAAFGSTFEAYLHEKGPTATKLLQSSAKLLETDDADAYIDTISKILDAYWDTELLNGLFKTFYQYCDKFRPA